MYVFVLAWPEGQNFCPWLDLGTQVLVLGLDIQSLGT